MALVAGIIIAIGAIATYAAVSSGSTPEPPTGNGDSTNSEPRQIVVGLNESLNVEDVEPK
jgi:hypothetical protein